MVLAGPRLLAADDRQHSQRRRAGFAEYERDAELTKSLPERNYLTKRAARLNRGS